MNYKCPECQNFIDNYSNKQPTFNYSENPEIHGTFAPICPKCGHEMNRLDINQ